MSEIHGRAGEYVASLRARALQKMGLCALSFVAGLVALVLVGGPAALGGSGLDPVIAVIGLAGMIGGIAVSRSASSAYQRAHVGLVSEDRVGKALKTLGATSVVHGALLGAGGDADHVVLGPILAVVETKTGRGRVTYDGKTFRAGNRSLPGDPVRQAKRQATALGKRAGAYAQAVVCLVDMDGPPQVHGGVHVCSLADLPSVLSRLPHVLDPRRASDLGRSLGAS